VLLSEPREALVAHTDEPTKQMRRVHDLLLSALLMEDDLSQDGGCAVATAVRVHHRKRHAVANELRELLERHIAALVGPIETAIPVLANHERLDRHCQLVHGPTTLESLLGRGSMGNRWVSITGPADLVTALKSRD
jgi:hypothetical protein